MFLALVISATLALAVWWFVAHAREIPASWNGPLKSASFAPFRDGQSPLKEIFPSSDQIESDLVKLKGLFEGVRTYTSLGGMEVVPELAAKYGFTLTHSAWLGRESVSNASNEKEITALIETANRYPQAVKRVIVGNEVLLRQDLEAGELIAYIDRVRSAIKQPVSYADVWAFWLKNPQVADHVDYITIHILPYWEDEPVSVEEAQQHMLEIIAIIKARFPGKPILVGETGWPTEGRSRGPASADLLTAAAFVRGLPKLAADNQFDYNVVEAYDQSWKANLEGTVGARWGIFDASRHEKFSLNGPVTPIDKAMPRVIASVLLGCLVALALLPFTKNMQGALLAAIGSQFFSAAMVEAVYKSIRLTVSPASFTWMQQHVLFFMADRHWLSDDGVAYWYKLLLQTLAEPLAYLWGWLLAVFSLFFAAMSLIWVRALLAGAGRGRAASLVRFSFTLYGLGAIAFAVMFSTSGRYMDIPLPQFYLPLIVALMLLVIRQCDAARSAMDCSVTYKSSSLIGMIFWLLPLAAMACLWGEIKAMMRGADFIARYPTLEMQIPQLVSSILANHELLLWCVACVMLMLPFHAAKRVE